MPWPVVAKTLQAVTGDRMRQLKLCDVFRIADEIAVQDVVRNGIVSVSSRLHQITEKKAADSMAMLGVVTTDGRYPIRVEKSSRQVEAAHGTVWAYKDYARIIIAAENTCWTRMSVAKELAHLYIGVVEEEYPEIDMLLLAARTARQNLRGLALNDTIANDEIFCFYLAIELLLPFGDLRDELLEMRERKATYLEMARRFMVPERIISHFFESGWSEISWQARRGSLA